MKKSLSPRLGALLLAAVSSLSLVGCSSNVDSAVPLPDTPSVSSIPAASPAASKSPLPTAETTPNSTPTPAQEDSAPATAAKSTSSDEEKDELGLTKQQRNSFSMLYHLAITAEDIRISKNNRLILDDIYTDLLNDINPGAIDEITQDHLENLRDIIKTYIDISVKRDRLQYIYNQRKAASIRQAVPNPLAVLSMTNALDWPKLAASAVFTIVDSYNNYKLADEAADQEFLMSGWDLDDQEISAIQKNRERAFDYMVDMVQEYGLNGKMTLNEHAIETFSEICQIQSVHQKIRRLESEKKTYRYFGNYWLELADCYYETKSYKKCLDCVNQYNSLSTDIYRKDYNYVAILPKAIVAAQNVYDGDAYISNIEVFADAILENTNTEEWSVRYFAAQTYLDLYSRTHHDKYLNAAYNIAYDNVTILLDEQREQNAVYLADVKPLELTEPDYRFMTEQEKKAAKTAYQEEKKRVKDYNHSLETTRKTELPPLYEPLILNCDLLFALAEEMQIDDIEKHEIESVLQTRNQGVFITQPINDRYSFFPSENDTTIDLTSDEIIIPVKLLSENAKIIVEITDNGITTTCDDCIIDQVKREGESLESFYAHVSSETMQHYAWTKDSRVTVKIMNIDDHDTLSFHYKVSDFKDRKLIKDKVGFEAE